MIQRIGPLQQYKNDKERMADPPREHSAALMSSDIGLPEGVTTSSTSLVFSDGINLEDWKAVGAKLGTIETGIQWWVGDWWHYGNHVYGERKATVVEATARGVFRFRFKTMMSYGWVAGMVPTSNRLEVLSFSHHIPAASLPADEQKEWLEKAVSEKWSVKQLGRAIKEARDKRSEDEKDEARALHWIMMLGFAAGSLHKLTFSGIHIPLLEHVQSYKLRAAATLCDETAKSWASVGDEIRAAADKAAEKAAEPERKFREENPELAREFDERARRSEEADAEESNVEEAKSGNEKLAPDAPTLDSEPEPESVLSAEVGDEQGASGVDRWQHQRHDADADEKS